MEDPPPPAPSPPESSTSISTNLDDPSERPKKARRTFLTQNACTRCRQKKSKCDGKRPTCARCEKNGSECLYDVAQEGITRMQNLQTLLARSIEHHDRLMTLFDAFKQSSDSTATNLLARLRLGESIESLVADIEATYRPSVGSFAEPSSARPDGMGMHSWPASPLDQQSWTPWNTRAHPDDRTLSHSSDSTINTPRVSRSYRGVDLILSDPRSAHPSEHVDGYYQQSRPPEDEYENQQRMYFDPVQWQQQNGDINPFSPAQAHSERPSPEGGDPSNQTGGETNQ